MFGFRSFFDDSYKEKKEPYPDFFLSWDEAVNKQQAPGYVDSEDLYEIIDIYLSEEELDKAKQAIEHALKFHADNEDVVYDIMLLMNDYQLWNDLINLCDRFKEWQAVWLDGHRLTALLHLGMEEHAFHSFSKMKTRYADNKEDLITIYLAMGEALYDVDLYDAGIEVMEEAVTQIEENDEFYWQQIYCYSALKDMENVYRVADIIQQMKPLDGETWDRLGSLFYDLDDMERAIEAFEFSRSLEYKESNNLLKLLQAYKKNENTSKALEIIDEFLGKTDNYITFAMGADFCSKMEQWEKASQYNEKAISQAPHVEILYINQSKYFEKMGEYKKAILILEEGLKNTSDSEGKIAEQLEILRKQYPEY